MTIGKVLSESVTRSPIELLWTAKNIQNKFKGENIAKNPLL